MKTISKLLAGSLAALAMSAHAHHAMDYALPATAMDGLLSGLGHPIIGTDHFLFIAAAGVLAARFRRGWLLPLAFVIASTCLVALRYFGADAGLGELPVAGSLVVLGAIMLAAWRPGQGIVAVLFLAAGALHGHALAEAIVGAETTPLLAYLAGLALIQCAIGVAAWRATAWLAARRPQFPVQKIAGAVVGAAGLLFAGLSL